MASSGREEQVGAGSRKRSSWTQMTEAANPAGEVRGHGGEKAAAEGSGAAQPHPAPSAAGFGCSVTPVLPTSPATLFPGEPERLPLVGC